MALVKEMNSSITTPLQYAAHSENGCDGPPPNRPIDRVIHRLTERGCEPQRSGSDGSWMAHCPAHEDRKPSLSVREAEDGKVLLLDFGACATENVLEALGLSWADLFPTRRSMLFDYVDATGSLLYQVGRTEPGRDGKSKSLTHRRPDGHGGWINKLGEVRKVLYRLPELLESIKREEVVFIPEGEKHVDRLRALDLAATCSSGGSGPKWP